MPSPVFSSGTIGAALPRQAVAPGKNAASLLDLTSGGLGGFADMEACVVFKLVIGSVAPTAGLQFLCYYVYGPAMTIVGTTSTSVSVTSLQDVDVGQKVFLFRADGSAGEIVTVASVSGSTMTIGSTTFTYSANDFVYLIEQSPRVSVPVAPITGSSYQANSVLTNLCVLGTGRWCCASVNSDSTATITVLATPDILRGYQ